MGTSPPVRYVAPRHVWIISGLLIPRDPNTDTPPGDHERHYPQRALGGLLGNKRRCAVKLFILDQMLPWDPQRIRARTVVCKACVKSRVESPLDAWDILISVPSLYRIWNLVFQGIKAATTIFKSLPMLFIPIYLMCSNVGLGFGARVSIDTHEGLLL